MRRYAWHLIGAVAAISTLVVLSGCDSAGAGGGSDNGGSSDNPPTLDPVAKIPDTPDELTNAGGNNPAATYLDISTQSFSTVATFMDPPPEAQSVESADISAQQAIRSETRIWTSGGLTVTWTYEELADRHRWTIVWDGEYDVDETTYSYDDWTLMEGYTLKTAYGGRFDLYDQTQPGSSTAAVTWNWCEDSGDYYYAFGVNGGLHFQLATNGSGSEGELDVYASGSGFLTCGTPKTTDETFIVGWDSDGGVWEDLQDSSNNGSWGTAPGVEEPLTDNTDDA